MIRSSLVSLAGLWVAREVDRGEIPKEVSVPLTLVLSRIPTPMLIAGAVGYGLYRLNIERRAKRAKDVTPKGRGKRPKSRGRTAPRRKAPKATI